MSDRKDSWTQDDDSTLAETVLKHVRTGSTQSRGYEEAAELLNRTASACAFRWNSEVRKKYQDRLRLAKEERKQLKNVELEISETGVITSEADPYDILLEDDYPDKEQKVELIIEDVNGNDITEDTFLEEEKQAYQPLNYRSMMEQLGDYIKRLESENKRLEKENKRLQQQHVNEDLTSLLSILDRAREQIKNRVG